MRFVVDHSAELPKGFLHGGCPFVVLYLRVSGVDYESMRSFPGSDTFCARLRMMRYGHCFRAGTASKDLSIKSRECVHHWAVSVQTELPVIAFSLSDQ
jgi:hypothetical protein